MKKSQTIYSVRKKDFSFCVAVNAESPGYISVYDGIEPCSGVLRHWGTREQFIKELETIISEIKKMKI